MESQLKKLQKPPTTKKRVKRIPLKSPRLKQLYVGKYQSISDQLQFCWQDKFKTGMTVVPGLFIHALCLPQFTKSRKIGRWPLLSLIAFNLIVVLESNHFPTIRQLSKLLSADEKTIRTAVNWCIWAGMVQIVTNGYRGRHQAGSSRRYVITTLGQEVLNQYFAFCYEFYSKLENDVIGRENLRYRKM